MLNIFSRLSGVTETVGVDIGSHSIKVAQVTLARNGYLLSRAGSTPTPHGAIKSGVIDDRLAVAEAIHTLFRTLGIHHSLIVTAVAGPTVVVRQVKLPAMPENQLRKSIQWEARNYISFPVEDSLLEFQILGTSASEGTPQMDVMMVASPRDLVDSRVGTLEQANLDPMAIELEPFALMRGATDVLNNSGKPDETVALVEIGATFTHITITTGGQFVLTRSVTVAGDVFTQAIAKILNVEEGEAEEIKETEVRVVSDEVSRSRLSPIGQEASRALEPQLDELIREIRRSFAFFDYQQSPSGGSRTSSGVSRIILSGGSAKLGGLSTLLQDQLGIPVELFRFIPGGVLRLPEEATEIQEQAPILAVALGLALREPMLVREKESFR